MLDYEKNNDLIVLQEILLTYHIRVGASDTINVKELLFRDLVDLSHHLQVICICTRIKT